MSRYQNALSGYASDIADKLVADSTSITAFSLTADALSKDQDETGLKRAAIFRSAVDAIRQQQALLANPPKEAAARKLMEDRYATAIFAGFAHLTDPTAQSASLWKNLDWICATYLGAQAPLVEDLYKVHDDLRDFEAFKSQMDKDKRTLETCSSFNGLTQILRPFQRKRDQKRAEQAQRRMQDSEMQKILSETSIIYGKAGKVVVPQTQEACIYWGRQTRWCTSAEKAANYFAQYNDKEPLWIYLAKPTAKERIIYGDRYSSYKFTGTQGHLYTELDSDPGYVPPFLDRLIQTALREASPQMQRHLRKYGGFSKYQAIPVPDHASQWSDLPTMKILLLEIANGKFPAKEEALSYILNFVPEQFTDEADFILSAARIHQSRAFAFASEKLKTDPVFFYKACAAGFAPLGEAGPALQNDKNAVEAAFRLDNYTMTHAAPELRGDKTFMLLMQNISSKAYDYALPDLKENKGYVLAVLNSRHRAISYISAISKTLQNDRDIILAFVSNGGDYRHISDAFRSDREIALVAIKASSDAFDALPYDFQKEEVFVLLALDSPYPCAALQTEATMLMKNRDVALRFIERSAQAFQWAPAFLKSDRAVVMDVVKRNIKMFAFASDAMRDDKSIALAAIARDGDMLRHASHRLRSDREVVRVAIRSRATAASHATLELRLDRALKVQGSLLRAWDKVADGAVQSSTIFAGSLKTAWNRATNSGGTSISAPETRVRGLNL